MLINQLIKEDNTLQSYPDCLELRTFMHLTDALETETFQRPNKIVSLIVQNCPKNILR